MSASIDAGACSAFRDTVLGNVGKEATINVAMGDCLIHVPGGEEDPRRTEFLVELFGLLLIDLRNGGSNRDVSTNPGDPMRIWEVQNMIRPAQALMMRLNEIEPQVEADTLNAATLRLLCSR